MADRKLSTDTGAQNLLDTIGCQISGTLHVDKKRFKFLKDRSTRLLVLSNLVPQKNVCGLYCFGSIYAPTAEFAYSTLELQSAKTYEPSDKKGFGLLIMFEKADKKNPLKFICAGRKESEEWVDKINEAINEDKRFSQDSAYASGGSFIGERPKRTSAAVTDFEKNQQHVPNYDEIDEETMYQTNKSKDAEDTNRKERKISEKRISSREAKQTAKAELQDQTWDYENPEEQHYLNENLGMRNHDNDHTRRKEPINSRDARPAEASKQQDETYETYEDRLFDSLGNQNHGVPETRTNVRSQSFISSDTTTQGNVTQKILAQEACAKLESRRTRPQKKQDASPSINEQNTTSSKKSATTVPKKPFSKKHRQQTVSYSANDPDASCISIQEESLCNSMPYLSVASGVSDAVPMTTMSSRVEEEALYVNTHESFYENDSRRSKVEDELSTGNPAQS